MIEGSLSRRYGKALFQLALEQKREEVVSGELERFGAAYVGSPLQDVLNNPAFNHESRKRVLLAVAQSLELSPLAVRFLSLLLDRDRLIYLPTIIDRYRKLLNSAKGRVEGTVVGAAPLDPDMVQRLRQALGAISGNEVVLHEETDAELIGGVLVRLEGTVYDGTVRMQLNQMKQRIARES
jgi:F-type H+-transporting ATPase subunit delta